MTRKYIFHLSTLVVYSHTNGFDFRVKEQPLFFGMFFNSGSGPGIGFG